MPNWTTNNLTITGKSKDLRNFLKKVINEKGDFDFNKIIPEPRTLEEYNNQGYVGCNANEIHIQEDKDKPWFDWYSWHCDRWGTKWNACDTYIDDSEINNGILRICFETAWCAPEPIMNKIGEKLTKNINLEWDVEYEDEDGTFKFLSNNNIIKQYL